MPPNDPDFEFQRIEPETLENIRNPPELSKRLKFELDERDLEEHAGIER